MPRLGNILVVDDEAPIRKLLREALTSIGYDTIHRVAETRTPRLGTLGVQVGRDVEDTILRLHQKDERERFTDERELMQRLGECIERRAPGQAVP